MEAPSSEPAAAALPPDPPRAVTPAIAWRIRTEPAVRVWWLAAALMTFIAIVYAGNQMYDRHKVSQLIEHGTPAVGKIIGFVLKTSPGQRVDPNEPGVTIEYPDPAGKPMRSSAGVMHTASTVGAKVNLHYDPADPLVWTDQTAPPGWIETVFGAMFILPIALVLGLIAWWQTTRIRNTWQTAPAYAAVVTDRKQTPVAPMSWAVRCSLRDGNDRRLFVVHVPRAGIDLSPGSEIWVLMPKRGKPVAAGWFG
jgi:hypothetical protein